MRVFGVCLAAAACLGLLLYATGGGEAETQVAPAAPKRSTHIHVQAKTLSLAEITSSAHKIFRGKVSKVQTKKATLEEKGKKVEVDVREVTFDVAQVIKGDVGATITVRQLPALSAPVQEGEELLWYLAKESPLGLTQPIGVYSGHFKVLPEKNGAAQKVAVNLVNNEGLWNPKRPLFANGKEFPKEKFVGELNKIDLPAERRNKILQLAESGNRPGPVPLELIVTATRVNLN